MDHKKWNLTVVICFYGMLLAAGLFNYAVDPFLHYGTGLGRFEYPLLDERYINDGIQRNFDYEMMITGTSMSWNFAPSVAERLWNKPAIKTAYSGAHFNELANSIETAIRHNPELDTVICSLDPNNLALDPYSAAYSGNPDYMYDDNPFNDVNYLLNKEVITKSIAVINYTRAGNTTVSFDDYGRFDTYMPSGREAVLASYARLPVSDSILEFGDEDREKICSNLSVNFISLACDNPDVEFIFYIPPYSYCYWDGALRSGQMDYVLEAEKYAVSLLLECDNVSVYAFDDDLDTTTDLDNYTDTLHYTAPVCESILERISAGEGRLTDGNYEEYFERIKDIYGNYDYDL